MTKLSLSGAVVGFSAQKRALRYKLGAFNEQTSDWRKITIAPGAVDFSASQGAQVNLEHDRTRPIGRLVEFDQAEDGIYSGVRFIDTTLARDTLTEIREGLRTGISMELSDVELDDAGTITSAVLTGAGICVAPAFESARIVDGQTFAALDDIKAAVDALNEAVAAAEAETPEDSPADEVEDEDAEDNSEAPTEKEDNMSDAAAVPTALNAAGNGGKALALSSELVAKAYKTKDIQLTQELNASLNVMDFALSNTTSTANTPNVEQSQWLGELWSGVPYTRKYAPLVSSGVLTSWKVEGWRFLVKPVVGDYAGDLAAIASNSVTTEPYSEEAQRLAGGWKLDRKFRDFGNTEFIDSFFKAAAEDYARKSDAKVLAAIAGTTNTTVGGAYVTGVAKGATRIVDGALDMLAAINTLPTFALVSADVYREMFLTTEFDNLKYVNQALGLDGGTAVGLQIVPVNSLAADTVIVGHKNAIQFFELGGVPIRVSALDVANGGEDEAVFGYYAIVEHETDGIVKVLPPV